MDEIIVCYNYNMNIADYFFIIFLLTVLVTRIALYFRPTPGPTIKGFRLHHYHLGILFIAIALLFRNVTIYAIGVGLFVDELTYIIIRGKSHKDNYSTISLIGTLLFIIIVFLFREQLIIF